MSANAAGARVRAAAARAVNAVGAGGRSLDAALQPAENDVAPGDRSLLRMLCYGAVRFHWRLSAQVDAFLRSPLKARDGEIHALLVLGVYQLTDTRISDHAAVSLTVEATRLLRRPKLKGLVNAVLRSFLRQPPEIGAGGDEVRFDHPLWLIDRLRADWPDDWQAILEANNAQAPMWLRVNAARGSADAYLARLAAEADRPVDEVATRVDGIEAGLRLSEPCDVDALPGFRDGDVSIQDGAAQLAAPWLSDPSRPRILDACAVLPPGARRQDLGDARTLGA